MKLEFKLKFKVKTKDHSDFGSNSFGCNAALIWRKSRTTLFYVLLVGVIVAGWVIWQQSLKGAGWSDQRKQEFSDSQNKNIEFKEEAFKNVIDKIEERETENNQEYQPIKDIFTAY